MRYNKRSNVESAFGALKRKYGHYVRSKTPIAQENETLCKIICYNISILIEALISIPDLKIEFLEVEA